MTRSTMVLLGCGLILLVAAPLRAQTGCTDSPENPTAVLALVGGVGAAEVGGGLRPTHLTPPSEAGGDPDSLRDGWGNRHEKQVLRCAQDDNFQGAVRMDSKDKRRSRVAR